MQNTSLRSPLGALVFFGCATSKQSQPVNECQPRESSENSPHPKTALTTRQVVRLPEKSVDIYTRAFNEASRWHSPILNDMDGHILAGRDDCIVKLIQQGYSLNPVDNNAAPVLTAVIYGSVKTLLTLLRHGADPDTFTDHSTPTGHNIDHVLSLTEDIDKLVLLLSYGAKTQPLEINYAFAQERLLHLLVYFHWQKQCQQPVPRPETAGQLNELVARLPVSEIHRTVELFERNRWSLNCLPEIAPRGLESFWLFLKEPFD